MTSPARPVPGFTQLRPAGSYPRVTPGLFNASSHDRDLLRWFYAQVAQPSVETPAEGFIHFERCTVFDGRFILDSDLEWVAPSLADWGVEAGVKDWIKDTIRRSDVAALDVLPDGWHHVLFTQCNSENYGHFLCEAAPKIANVALAGLKRIRYLLPQDCAGFEPFTTRMFEHFGIQAEPVPFPSASTAAVQDLYYFTPTSQHNFRKSPTLLDARNAAVWLFGTKSQARHKLFVRRAPTDRRRIRNQDVVARLLAEFGYRDVYPGDMTLAEQVELFSGASHIAGSVGAGLTNMLFAPPGTHVLYIDNGVIDLFFWDLAGLCGQHFDWFFAQPLQPFSQAAFVADFRVSIPELRAALRRGMG